MSEIPKTPNKASDNSESSKWDELARLRDQGPETTSDENPSGEFWPIEGEQPVDEASNELTETSLDLMDNNISQEDRERLEDEVANQINKINTASSSDPAEARRLLHEFADFCDQNNIKKIGGFSGEIYSRELSEFIDEKTGKDKPTNDFVGDFENDEQKVAFSDQFSKLMREATPLLNSSDRESLWNIYQETKNMISDHKVLFPDQVAPNDKISPDLIEYYPEPRRQNPDLETYRRLEEIFQNEEI